jgi:Icc-related predicted phosphoesterase
MSLCVFVSDLHGSLPRYERLFALVGAELPELVLIGGDLLPFAGLLRGDSGAPAEPFIGEYLTRRLRSLRRKMGERYPRIALILGNDDPRREESSLRRGEREGLWRYVHGRAIPLQEGFRLYGYACIPPSPFLLKDWERYDVSRFVDVGSVPPTAGWRSVPAAPEEIERATIRADLEALAGDEDLRRSVFLFHAPPYGSSLDRAALDGRMVDLAPLDVHIGSIAIRRFVEERKPYLTLHGHAHESSRLTGAWRERIGDTWCFNAAHDGPELAVIRFRLNETESAERLQL